MIVYSGKEDVPSAAHPGIDNRKVDSSGRKKTVTAVEKNCCCKNILPGDRMAEVNEPGSRIPSEDCPFQLPDIGIGQTEISQQTDDACGLHQTLLQEFTDYYRPRPTFLTTSA